MILHDKYLCFVMSVYSKSMNFLVLYASNEENWFPYIQNKDARSNDTNNIIFTYVMRKIELRIRVKPDEYMDGVHPGRRRTGRGRHRSHRWRRFQRHRTDTCSSKSCTLGGRCTPVPSLLYNTNNHVLISEPSESQQSNLCLTVPCVDLI